MKQNERNRLKLTDGPKLSSRPAAIPLCAFGIIFCTGFIHTYSHWAVHKFGRNY